MEKRVRKSKKILENNTKKPKKNSPNLAIIEAILLSLIVVVFLLGFFFYMKVRIRKNDYLDKKDKIEEIIKNKKSEISNLEKEIESYKNVDESINNTKSSYFSLLKKLEESIKSGESDKKIAYLTFDDGPYYNTYRVFDILDQYDVKATFFTTNTNGEYCYDNKSENCWIRYREYINRGHTIANHTYTHAIFRGLYNSVDTFMSAVIDQENLIKEQTGGYITNIVRFPGGSVTAKGLRDPIIEKLRERGYGWVDWNSLDGDGGDLDSTEQAWSYFTGSIDENVEVILYHDYNWITTALLPDMIDYLRNNGYILLPLFYESDMVNK